MNRNNKKVYFYAVIDRNQNNQILTIACNKKDCIDYGYKFLRIKHFDHFKMWCELRNLNVDSDAA